MIPPIVITAFGTTSRARATYSLLDARIKQHLPNREIIWAYSSRLVGKRLQERDNITIQRPHEVLKQLVQKGHTHAILQSLHLLPGNEFHRLHHEVRQVDINCSLGMPLLCSPTDYHAVAEVLAPLIRSQKPDTAILVIGHGTYHPTWTAYLALETLLRQRFGPQIFVGVVEKYPSSEMVVNTVIQNGYSKVFILPFFLVAGIHYRRDILGDSSNSWTNRLQRQGVKVETFDQGLGMQPGTSDLVVRHIEDAIHNNTR